MTVKALRCLLDEQIALGHGDVDVFFNDFDNGCQLADEVSFNPYNRLYCADMVVISSGI